jgi:hypothetical protein
MELPDTVSLPTSPKNLRFGRLTAPVALLALCALVYFPLIYRLGFYWDDWPSAWFHSLWGPAGYLRSFASDRPALAWVFMVTSSVLGESPAGWQVFGLLARWLASLAFWWLLLGVWPQHERPAFWAAALFAVYPGFSQQYIAFTYSNAFLVQALTLVSFGGMVWAYRLRRWFWPLLALSLLAQALSLAMTEYFFGLELLRPALLYVAFAGPAAGASRFPWGRVRQALLRWTPFLAVWIPFGIDRVFFHKTPRGNIVLFEQLAADPFGALLGLARTIAGDFAEVNFLGWFWRLNPRLLNDFDQNIQVMFGGLAVATFIFTLAYLLLQSRPKPGEAAQPRPAERWAWQAIGLGVYAFLAGGWTIWVTNLHIELLFPWDRFTLITMLGTALLIAGLIGLAEARLKRLGWLALAVLALLAAVSAGLQFQHRLVYRQEWLAQRNFLWQLAWRIPDLEPGTVLLTSELPFVYYSDNSLTAPINWMYAPENRSETIPYLLYDVEARLGLDLPAIEPGQPVEMRYRAVTFEGSTSQAVVVFYDPPRCVKVIDPQVDRFLPVKPLYIREMVPLSQPALIRTGSPDSALPEHILGAEPPRGWCYYFEKAELYGQSGDWQQAKQMADKALKLTKHFTDKNVSELFPFIEAYAHTGDWERAAELSVQAYSIWDKTQYPLCDVWTRIAAATEPTPDRQAAIQNIKESLQCSLP